MNNENNAEASQRFQTNLPLMHEIPIFENFEEERQHRKERLAAAFRIFGRYGFSEGVAGHITARDPEETECFWVNPFGMNFSHISVSDLLLVDHNGDVIDGNYAVNQAAFAIHSAIHMERPEIVAAAHSHSLFGKAFSSLGKMLDPLTQDSCIFYNNHVLFDDYTGVVLDPLEGKRIAAALGHCKSAILKNHGLLTLGETVDEALWLFVTMERTCQAQLLADAAGGTHPIDDETADLTNKQIGNAFSGWFSAQPLFDKILVDEPDLLD